LHIKRSLGRNTLFQVMFAFRQDPLEHGQNVSGLAISKFFIKRRTAKFDLNLAIYERTDGLHCYFTYNTDLFDSFTIRQMMREFRILLEGVVENPDERLSNLPILSEPERIQLVHEWNETKADYCEHRCAHELFEEQASRTPDSPAVVFGNESLS